MESVVSVFALGGLANLFSFGFSIAMYILGALGVYTIAKRRGISNPWLAWVPVGSMWILGSISDQYQRSVNSRKTNRRKILLTVNIIPVVIAIALVVVMVVMFLQLIVTESLYIPQLENPYADSYYAYDGMSAAGSLVGYLLVTLVMALALFATAIVSMVFGYMCYYDLYRSCNPSDAVLFLVLGIIAGFLNNIFVFICREKDNGMRPPEIPAREYQTPPV